jgi:predicted O-methyltransferase YrrM
MSVDKEVLRKYKKNILIETGTYMGMTTKYAVEEIGDQKVYTIELQDYLYKI